jgi:hypothetical protein
MSTAALIAAGFAAAAAQSPAVSERFGNVFYTGADGVTRQLTREGKNGDAALGPDGRTVVFIRLEQGAGARGEGEVSSLWMADGLTGEARKVVGPHASDDPKREFSVFRSPVFSLNGRFVYVMADAWATSAAVHQVEFATGKERFVVDANSLAVLRKGRYAGYLVVSRHRYYGAPNYGSYDPCFVVRPDGKETFMVPGTDKDSCGPSMDRWMKATKAE